MKLKEALEEAEKKNAERKESVGNLIVYAYAGCAKGMIGVHVTDDGKKFLYPVNVIAGTPLEPLAEDEEDKDYWEVYEIDWSEF